MHAIIAQIAHTYMYMYIVENLAPQIWKHSYGPGSYTVLLGLYPNLHLYTATSE